jgi:hypothetical protein
MKILLHSILCLLVITSAASAVVPPSSHIGGYEALLYQTDEATGTPAGFIALTVATTGKLSGKLTTEENKTYPFTGTFDYDAGSDTATTTPALISIARGTLPALSLSLALKNSGQTLEATVTASGLPNRVATTGVKITPRPKTQAAEWAGKYTLAFTPSGEVNVGPSGSSYAGGVVDAAGTLKIAGKLSDGTTLTGTLLPDANRGYRTYLNVLKRPGSYFAGKINLVARVGEPGFHVVTATAPAADFFWNKPSLGASKDKAYPLGFGPLKLLLTMEPWVLPDKGQTLANLLGILTPNNTFQFDFDFSGAGLDLARYAGLLPKKLTLDAKNLLVPVYGDGFSPTTAALWAKIWTGKVDPLTGIYTGTLTLEDLLDLDGAGNKPAAIIKRKVTFQGVLFNTLDALKPLAAGNFLLPPLNAKLETILAGDIELGDVFEILGLGAPDPNAIFPGIPGSYTMVLDADPTDASRDANGEGGVTYTTFMKNLPAAGSNSTFSITPNLGSLTFNGKTLPLIADGRPLHLIYSNVHSSIKDSITVTVTISQVTGLPNHVSLFYTQVLSGRVFGRTVPLPAIAAYPSNQPPVKVK